MNDRLKEPLDDLSYFVNMNTISVVQSISSNDIYISTVINDNNLINYY